MEQKYSPDQPRDEDGRWLNTNPQSADITRVAKLSSSLDDDEQHAAFEYHNDDNYRNINGPLRTGVMPHPGEPEWFANTVTALDSAIEKGVAADDILVWRGVSQHASKAFYDAKPGDLITDYGFVSATRDKKVAHDFSMGYRGRMIEIQVPKGTHVLPMELVSRDVSTEREMVLPRGTRFQVISNGEKSMTLRVDGRVHKPIDYLVERLVGISGDRWLWSDADVEIHARKTAKYSPEQPRDPAGEPTGGQWSSDDDAVAGELNNQAADGINAVDKLLDEAVRTAEYSELEQQFEELSDEDQARIREEWIEDMMDNGASEDEAREDIMNDYEPQWGHINEEAKESFARAMEREGIKVDIDSMKNSGEDMTELNDEHGHPLSEQHMGRAQHLWEQHFERAKEGDLENYMDNSDVREHQRELIANSWSNLGDDELNQAARDFGKFVRVTPGLPNKWVVDGDNDSMDYARSRAIGNRLVQLRTMELLDERGLTGKTLAPREMQHQIWDDWKSSSTSGGGLALQLAVADEFGGVHRLDANQQIRAQKWADATLLKTPSQNWGDGPSKPPASDEGMTAMRAYARAQWETSQYLLAKAGIREMPVYRGLMLPRTMIDGTTKLPLNDDPSVRDITYIKLPDIAVQRNGAASTTSKAEVANSWNGVDVPDRYSTQYDRVVLRLMAPKTSILSLPVYGKNMHEESEVVLAGTKAKWKWDAWLNRAPKAGEVPMPHKGHTLWIDLNDYSHGPHWLYPRRAKTLKYSSDQPREEDGKWQDTGARARRALRSHIPATREKQQWAYRTADEVRRYIHGLMTDDNAPADITLKIGRQLHGIEVKTILEGKNDKITVRKESRRRKEQWARKNHAMLHTVVIDDRKNYGSTDYSGNRIYYRKGVGAFTLHGMTPVKNAAELRTLMGMKKSAFDIVLNSLGHTLWIGEHKYSDTQPRDDHGRWSDGGGELDTEFLSPPSEALNLIGQGKKANIAVEQVHNFLVKASKRDDNPDLTDLHVEGTNLFGGGNLGIARANMPQVPSAERAGYVAEMRERGVEVRSEKASPLNFKPAQREISSTITSQMYIRLTDPESHKTFKPIFVSKDNYVLDGHHRWAAAAALKLQVNDFEMPVTRVMLNHGPALRSMHDYDQRHGIEGKPHGKMMLAILEELKDAWVKYSPDQPRDDHGQWTDGSAATLEQPSSAYAPANAAGQTTEERFKDENGDWTPERQKLHDAIIKQFLGEHEASNARTVVFMGGGTASGKSTITHMIEGLTDAVRVDVDEIRKVLPEYKEMKAAGNAAASPFVHEEASWLGKQVTKQALAKHYNIVLDGTGNSTIEKIQEKVNEIHEAGYRVVAHYVTVDTDVAVERAYRRATTGSDVGRFVPEATIRKTHEAVSEVFPQALAHNLFDKATLWDTNDGGTIRVLDHINGETTIHNAQAYARFLAKRGTKGYDTGRDEPRAHRADHWKAVGRGDDTREQSHHQSAQDGSEQHQGKGRHRAAADGERSVDLELDALGIKYDDSQPRDDNGQWTSVGGPAVPRSSHFETYSELYAELNGFYEHKVTPLLNPGNPRRLSIMADIVHALSKDAAKYTAVNAQAKTTKERFTENGRYTPERQELHLAIVGSKLAESADKKAFKVSLGDIIGLLPEKNLKLKAKRAEAQDIAKLLAAVAQEAGVDIAIAKMFHEQLKAWGINLS